ncbi:MAG: hypothetical protein K8T10_10045 [Candidatus Eremiobacteraeota bacterium]|nr:hypothetical protein [Candidatus Eremiobacteraeota bacterium]
MKKWIQTLKITLVFFILSFGTAFACGYPYSMVPPRIAVVFLFFLCAVLYLETRDPVLPILFAIPGTFFLFLDPMRAAYNVRYLFIFILVVAATNILFLFTMENRKKRLVAGVLNFITLSVIISFILLSRYCPLMVHSHFTFCISNLQNIGIALEIYKRDNNGRYPKELADLTPNYLSKLPRCMLRKLEKGSIGARYYKTVYGISADDYKYVISQNRKAFTVYCGGRNHQGFAIPGNYPQYTSKTGLIRR